MAESSVKVIMTGDARKLLAEQAKVARAERATKQSLEGTAGAASKSERQMVALGQKYASLNATPIERARKRLDELNNSTVRAVVGEEKRERAIAHTVAQLARQEGITTRAAASQLGLNRRYADAADRMKSMSTSSGALTGKLTAIIGVGGTVATAIRAIGAALRFTREETDKAVQSLTGLEDSRMRLSQIAVDAEDLQQMEDTADQLSSQFGVDRDIVRNVIFSARSEGFDQAVGDIIKNAPIISPMAAAGVAGQVPGLFKNEGLKPMEAIAGTLTAAKASRLDFEAIAANLPKVAEGGALQDSTFAESAGVLSVMASRFASAETAADRLKGFATALATRQIESPDGETTSFAGMGIVEGFEALQSASDETRRKFLGDSQELNAAFELLSQELPTVKQRIAQVAGELDTIRSGGQSIVERQRAAAISQDTDIGRRRSALIEKRRAEIGREIANERQFAETGANRASAVDRVMQVAKEQGKTVAEQWIGQTLGEAAQTVGASEQQTEALTAIGVTLPDLANPITAMRQFASPDSAVRKMATSIDEKRAAFTSTNTTAVSRDVVARQPLPAQAIPLRQPAEFIEEITPRNSLQTVTQTEPNTRTALAPPPAPAQRGRGDSPSRVPAGPSFNADNSDVVRAVNAQTTALDRKLDALVSAMSNNRDRFQRPSFTAPSIRSQQLSEAANVD